jgi:elongator complex protein 3
MMDKKRKPVRTISGVAVVAVMTSPYPCPHGRCIMCPRGDNAPQSYTGNEPAAMRAARHDFDPYSQVAARLTQLSQTGHRVGKVELIVMGGTITARDLSYQRWFVGRCLEAMNDYPISPREKHPAKLFTKVSSKHPAQDRNEYARVRNVGMTFETRPDYAREKEINEMLAMGVTKVELGVQHIRDEVLEKIKRGHGVNDTIDANRMLRDSALKVGFHVMPGLPGSDSDIDLQMFKTIFCDDAFKPDYLKIYPTLVIRGTKLYEMWRSGEYEPLSSEEAAELIAKVKGMLPGWIRIQRVQRDIPSPYIDAGVKKSNLRQLARKELERIGGKCECIRCREVGHAFLDGRKPEEKEIELTIQKYDAVGGIEYFLSYEDRGNHILIGFLRLRFPGNPHRKELSDAALVRDLHIYGPMVPVGEKAADDAWQHRGYGTNLLLEAERIASDEGFERVSVMSGIGVRAYYRRFGYERDGPFMSKKIQS